MEKLTGKLTFPNCTVHIDGIGTFPCVAIDGVGFPAPHSLTPFAATPTGAHILDANGALIAIIYGDAPTCAIDARLKANAEFIVRACNAYQPMLDQLAAAGAKARELESQRADLALALHDLLVAAKDARAALAKAGAA